MGGGRSEGDFGVDVVVGGSVGGQGGVMSIIELECDEPLLQMGAKPAALLFVTPEGILMVRWIEGCSPEELRRVAETLERGVRFGDLEE
jgi:hypothetical protein